MKKPKFEIKNAKNGETYFVLKAANGEVIATSETYKSKQGLKNGILAVKKCAPVAETIDLT